MNMKQQFRATMLANTLLLIYILGSCSQSYSTSSRSNEILISISSSHNHTGHWNAKVMLEHEGNDDRPVDLTIKHATTKFETNEKVLIVATISAPRLRPGIDYELLPTYGYYKLHSEAKNWFQARKICEQEDAHLVILNSEAEVKALLRIWTRFPKIFNDWRNEWAYIGVHDLYKEGDYITIFDVPLNETGYSTWNPSDPNGGTEANCMITNRNTGKLADHTCLEVFAFFCEQEL